VLAVDDGTRSANVGGVVRRADLVELPLAQRVDAWCEPIRRTGLGEGRGVPRLGPGAVVAGGYNDGSGWGVAGPVRIFVSPQIRAGGEAGQVAVMAGRPEDRSAESPAGLPEGVPPGC
jgi:hypothetical protein